MIGPVFINEEYCKQKLADTEKMERKRYSFVFLVAARRLVKTWFVLKVTNIIRPRTSNSVRYFSLPGLIRNMPANPAAKTTAFVHSHSVKEVE